MLNILTLIVCVSPQTHASEDSSLKPAPEGQQRVRVVAQRGKSMEELGASKLPRPSAMSKSSEQLDQLWRDPTEPGGPVKDKRSVSFFAEVRETQGLVRGGMKHNVAGQKETAIVGQGQTQNQAQIKSVSRQSSETEESASASRSSCRTPSGSPGSHGPVTDEVRSSRPPSETPPDPPTPRCPETSEREIKSTSSTPTQTKLPCENRPSSR